MGFLYHTFYFFSQMVSTTVSICSVSSLNHDPQTNDPDGFLAVLYTPPEHCHDSGHSCLVPYLSSALFTNHSFS